MRSGPFLFRLWFTFTEPVDRRTYLRHGVGLGLLKYAVDAGAVRLATGEIWTPERYLSPFFVDRAMDFVGTGEWLAWSMVVWTLPFLWIGVGMTARRAADAGLNPWLSLLFFLPVVNYGLMLVLTLIPSDPDAPGWDLPEPEPVVDERLRSALSGIALGVGMGLGAVALSVLVLRSYGPQLFLAAPFVMGAATAWVHNRGHARSARETAQVVAVAFLMAGGAFLLLALEGLLCIVMAAPLALGLGLLGGVFGRAVALRGGGRGSEVMAALVILPVLLVTDARERPSPLYEVVSAVEVDASPEAVWAHVVAFSELPPPSRLVFRLGIAYPLRAGIEGSGVGAVRRCEFSTGAFVEPITAWEPGRRLSFDVVDQPPALEEWSPYARLSPPHLDGFFRSRRGEFRLVPLPDGRTRLEGSTWYETEIGPHLYWKLWADALISRIHERVLRHVAARAEAGRPLPAPDG